MWYIGAIVTLIFAMITSDAGVQHTFLIAAGLFAIAGEIGILSTRFKKFFDKEDKRNDGEV